MLKTNLEIELKFKVKNISTLFQKLKNLNPRVLYIKDEIFGTGEMRKNPVKIRKRTIYKENGEIKIEINRTTPIKDKVKKIIEQEVKRIPKKYICESSYEKIRYFYKLPHSVEVVIDFYPIGIFCEIEGELKYIKKTAKILGFSMKENIKKNIDILYVDWGKKNKKKFLFHWGFGRL